MTFGKVSDLKTTRTNNTTEPDWTVLDLPYVQDIIRQAAKRVHNKYPNVTELDDLIQEATIFVVTKRDLQQSARDTENLGLLQRGIEHDLRDIVLPLAKEGQKTLSYDKLVEDAVDAESSGYQLGYVVIETASDDYTRESVETLLPAVWDESFVYGLPQRDDAPDPDMPKGSSNKARGNNLSAYIADIKSGWEHTPLSLGERQALLLAYGLGDTQRDIAKTLGIGKSTVNRRILSGVAKIVAYLNGGYYAELPAH